MKEQTVKAYSSTVTVEQDDQFYPAEETTSGEAFSVETITTKAYRDTGEVTEFVTVTAKAFSSVGGDHVSVNVHAESQANQNVTVFDLDDCDVFSIAVGDVTLFVKPEAFRVLQDRIRNPQ